MTDYCPSCGRADVIVGLDSVLLETRPEVRRHACRVGGPGARSAESDAVRERRAKGYCATCGAKGSKRAGRWGHMRPQPDGSPHDHAYVPGPRSA